LNGALNEGSEKVLDDRKKFDRQKFFWEEVEKRRHRRG
jgi:hypothetical protein